MSQSVPEDFNAVLGGQNLLPRDAVVLGGLAGAEQKLAHELRSRHQSIDGESWQLPDPIDPQQERARLSRIAKGLSTLQIDRSLFCHSKPSVGKLSLAMDGYRHSSHRIFGHH